MSDTSNAASLKGDPRVTVNSPDLPTISPIGEVVLLKGGIEEAEQQARDLNEKVTHALEEMGLPVPVDSPAE